uniref:Uncharacterized protein n=1 Tax=Anguilla anguilla TaxID=7936 RepID=A0A0E9WK48_ANGAN
MKGNTYHTTKLELHLAVFSSVCHEKTSIPFYDMLLNIYIFVSIVKYVSCAVTGRQCFSGGCRTLSSNEMYCTSPHPRMTFYSLIHLRPQIRE